MTFLHVVIAVLLLAPAVAMAQEAIVISGGRVLSPEGARWLDGQDVVIEGDRITDIAPTGSFKGTAHRIDAAGMYVIPGLIDLHTHLLLHPYNEATWNDQVLKESLELRTVRATAQARATVAAGFTTIRELGTEGAGFADVALRDAGNQGIIVAPRIFASTRAIVATGCYGPAGFDPRWVVPKGAQEASGPEAVRLAVREQIAAGADWVKLYTDYRRYPGSPATPTFALDEIRAGVEEARSAGKPVAAHATTDEGIRRAVEAGVNTIEHGYGASRETLQLMKDRGITLCPTMAAAEAVSLYAGWKSEQPPPPAIKASRDSFKMAREIGVKIACGSDAGVFAHGTNARELELMVDSGMSPGEAVRSATLVAAGVLNRSDLGRLAKGAAADAVVLRADPLADIGALRKVAAVVARGRVVVESSGKP
jgi:imidazolonepropionase-like amidohydrolase